MGDLEVDTRLEAVDDDGWFRARLSPDWEIWGPNGGYLAVIALRAAGAVARVPRPAAFTGHFLGVGRFEAVDVRVRTIKAGRRSESFGVSITQGDRVLLEAMVRTAAEGPGLEHDVSSFPEKTRPADLKPIEELVPEDAPGPPFPFWNNFEVRPVWPERFDDPVRRAHAPEFREWFRFLPRSTFDDPWVDAGRSLLMIDTASWIAASQPHPNQPFTAPNLDVTTWFHQSDADCAWLLTDHDCRVAQGGMMGTHGRVWSENGKLLASGGAQLFCVPTPERGEG